MSGSAGTRGACATMRTVSILPPVIKLALFLAMSQVPFNIFGGIWSPIGDIGFHYQLFLPGIFHGAKQLPNGQAMGPTTVYAASHTSMTAPLPQQIFHDAKLAKLLQSISRHVPRKHATHSCQAQTTIRHR